MITPLNPRSLRVPVCQMLWVCPVKAHQLKLQVSILSSLSQWFILQTPRTALANRGRHTASLHRDPRGPLINTTCWGLPFTSESKASHSRERRDPLAFPPVQSPPPRLAVSHSKEAVHLQKTRKQPLPALPWPKRGHLTARLPASTTQCLPLEGAGR